MNRRLFLRLSGLAALTGVMPLPTAGKSRSARIRSRELSLYNINTGESLETTYRVKGTYLPDALQEINHILRDYRNDEVREIDSRLIDLLFTLGQTVSASSPFHVISGYRSPETNARLRQLGRGVAKNSLHMEGRAIDIRLPDLELGTLRRAAVALKRGGVGFYPRSDFIHVDVGRVRYWDG